MIHHVFANRSNIGDWLSAIGIQALLAPCKVTEHLCDQPFVAGTLGELSTAGEGDLIVIGGGGLFMDYFEPKVDDYNGLLSYNHIFVKRASNVGVIPAERASANAVST